MGLDITERHCMNYMIYCLYDECDTVGVDTVKVEAYNFFFRKLKINSV